MNLKPYSRLHASTLEYCERGAGCGFGYTVAMLVLGSSFCLDLLSIVNVLWALRLLHLPYGHDGRVHPEHYVYALLYGTFIANTILARVQCNADYRLSCEAPEIPVASNRRLGPAYVLGSVVAFVLTLALGLLANR